MAVEMEVVTVHARPHTMAVVGDPDMARVRHPRILDLDGRHVHDRSGPRQSFPEAIVVVAPDEILSALETRKDAGGVVGTALVGEITEVPDDVVRAHGGVPGRDQGLVMLLDGSERALVVEPGGENGLVPEMAVRCEKCPRHDRLRNCGGTAFDAALRG